MINQLIKNIEIILNEITGLVTIKLTPGWKVYFKEKSWFKELGFDENDILTQEINYSKKVADLLRVQKIYINSDLVSGNGSWMNNKKSSVIYSFDNNKRYGAPISISVDKKRYHILTQKCFNTIILKFHDDKDNQIDFEGALVTTCLQINQA